MNGKLSPQSFSRVGVSLLGAVILFAVYALTLAPGVTFWDAGEFIAAAHSLGVPHPPGTPLFVLIINVWAKLFFFLPYAVATNLFSAAATATAAAVAARLVQRATGSRAMALAAVLTAGAMSSVWLNATETEVYAASLLLAMAMVWAGERAGRENGERWTSLVAYLMVLAVPLHLSALVTSPVAIMLATWTAAGPRWRRAIVLGGVFLIAMGLGRMSPWLMIAGAALALASVLVRDGGTPVFARMSLPLAVMALAAVAGTALAFMYVRAQFDPAINQGNPGTWDALQSVIARKQYAVSPIWPRMAPLWVQLGNLGQYADWQVALSAGPTVMPSILRSLTTALFLMFGYSGAVAHWHADRRTFWALLTLLVCGSLGVVAYLNMHAGPSIAYGILPENTVREARERDYFFVFAFWAWGLWAGMGAVTLMKEYGRPAWTGVLLAAIPIVMNWRAVTRRAEPERALPLAVAEALLESAPPDAVLFVVGDNDSYPLWYAQEVLGMRPDVTPVTLPLLPTRWYREELARRHGLLDSAALPEYERNLGTARAVAAGAARLGRPLVAAATLNRGERQRLLSADQSDTAAWQALGYVYVAPAPGGAALDSAALRRWSAWLDRTLGSGELRESIDPVNHYFMRVLKCPEQLLEMSRAADSSRVDSVCNYR